MSHSSMSRQDGARVLEADFVRVTVAGRYELR
jgi:hypothetical protein